MAQSFAAGVDAWCRARKEDLRYIYLESSQRVVATMQTPVAQGGNLPVDTGFMRSSLVARIGLDLPPVVTRPDDGVTYSYDEAGTNLVISGAEITDTMVVVYTANYARYQEYGTRGQPGRGFVRLAAQQWPRIVSEVVAEANSRRA